MLNNYRTNLLGKSAIFIVLLLTLLNYNLPSIAQTSSSIELNDQIKEVEKAIIKGQRNKHILDRTDASLRVELLTLRQEKIRISTSIRETEARIYNLERDIRTLNEQEVTKSSELHKHRYQFGQALIALKRLSSLPPQALLAYPAPPPELVRTAILLRTTVPQIEKKAKRLQKDLFSLELTQTRIKERKADLRQASISLENRRYELNQLDRTKSNARRKNLAARQIEEARLERLTEEVQTLRELFDRLREEKIERELGSSKSNTIRKLNRIPKTRPRRLEPEGEFKSSSPFGTASFSTARGKLTYPVIGTVTGKYNSKTNKGQRRKGVKIETQPGAQVVSPYNGRIVFSGPFKRYGRLLIIEHGEGYHTLLAGMSHIEGSTGQWLLAGEPVGFMAQLKSGRPALYMELRRNGQPINPKPWLMIRKGVIKG